jgi:hypothetical protein
MALDVKSAVQTARGHLSEVLQIPEVNLLLEEVERTGSSWDVTFSYSDPGSASLANILGTRKYKIVGIDAATGGFISVKIRNLAYERSA